MRLVPLAGCGRTTSHYRGGRWLLPQLGKKGYLHVDLFRGGKGHIRYVQRLVALVWVPNPHNHPQVNHKDGNKQHNHYRNLEWVTPQQNVDHAIATGLRNNNVPVDCFSTKTGKKLRTFESMLAAELASRGKCSAVVISDAVRGNILTAGGYQWRYASENITRLPSLTAGQISNAIHTNGNYCVRNKTTCEKFTSHESVRAAGYNPNGVANMLSGRTRTHANCEWERLP